MTGAPAMRRAVVIYVHGLWMPGAEGLWLQRYLRRGFGFELRIFRYRPERQTLPIVLTTLRRELQAIDAPSVHLLGHSLGGLIIQRYLDRYTMGQSGRVVFLGTPANGSISAQRLARSRWGRSLLGRAAADALLSPREHGWTAPRELGIIAGTRSVGAGRLLSIFNQANDGTVTVAETRMTGAREHLTLPVSHMGMLLSVDVARETGSFLQYGRFSL